MAKGKFNDLFGDMKKTNKMTEEPVVKTEESNEAPIEEKPILPEKTNDNSSDKKPSSKAETAETNMSPEEPVEAPAPKSRKRSASSAADIFVAKTVRKNSNHTFYLPDDLYAKLEETAKQHGLSLSNVLTTILDDFYGN